ncbi:MAG: L,D-transpeptidase [Stenomitos frigidus ULC029]
MTATVRDDRLSRSVMFICVGAALVLLGIQWRAWSADAQSTSSLSRNVSTKVKQASSTGKNAMNAKVSSTDATALAKKDVKLIVDLSDRQVSVYQAQALVTRYSIAIGQPGWETPSGSFKVLEMQRDPKWQHPITGEIVLAGSGNPLGKRWIGFLYAGRTHIGFHGTDQEDLIGQAVSHGCIRMRNQDVVALYEKVSPGTTVDVRP